MTTRQRVARFLIGFTAFWVAIAFCLALFEYPTIAVPILVVVASVVAGLSFALDGGDDR